MSSLVIYCADIGSIAKNKFGWARLNCTETPASEAGQDISDFADRIADDLNSNHPVALGFECPLFIPGCRASQVYSHAPAKLKAIMPGAAGALAQHCTRNSQIMETLWVLTRIQPPAKCYDQYRPKDSFHCGLGRFIHRNQTQASFSGKHHCQRQVKSRHTHWRC